MLVKFTSRDVERAALEEDGPFHDWLRRVQEGGGDVLLRRFALQLLRRAESPRSPPAELLDQLAVAIDDPEAGGAAVRAWMGCDSWFWREIAKLMFEWGGVRRAGDPLVRQVAVVTEFALWGRDADADITWVCGAMEGLPERDAVVVDERRFWDALEWRTGDEMARDERCARAGMWCDGYAPQGLDQKAQPNRIRGRVYVVFGPSRGGSFGSGRDESWTFELQLPAPVERLDDVDWSAILPERGDTGWLTIDHGRRHLIVVPADAVRGGGR